MNITQLQQIQQILREALNYIRCAQQAPVSDVAFKLMQKRIQNAQSLIGAELAEQSMLAESLKSFGEQFAENLDSALEQFDDSQDHGVDDEFSGDRDLPVGIPGR